MSSDPLVPDPERFRYYITSIEIQPPITDPNCKISVKVFADDELIYSLPGLDNAQPLRWSRLLRCDVSPCSRIVLRLCKSLEGKHRSFNFPSYQVSEVNEGDGKMTLEHPEVVWIATIKSLAPTVAEQLFPAELDRLNRIECVSYSPKQDESAKHLFRAALQFSSIAAKASILHASTTK